MSENEHGALHAPLGLLAELTHRCPLGCPYCSNPLALDARVDEERGVDVAVAQVAEIHDRELVLAPQVPGVSDQLGDPIARNDHVLVHLADLHLGHRCADRLASSPQTLGLPGLGCALQL